MRFLGRKWNYFYQSPNSSQSGVPASHLSLRVYPLFVSFFQAIGRSALGFINYLGQLAFLVREIFISLTRGQRRSMAVHPIDYLVTPRILAMTISVPLLIAESAALGMIASYVVGVGVFKVEAAYWVDNMIKYVDLSDVAIALIKGLSFGLLIVIISCHQGMKASNGAVGVGRGTTDAMVFSSLAILIVNFFLTLIMQIIFPASLFSS